MKNVIVVISWLNITFHIWNQSIYFIFHIYPECFLPSAFFPYSTHTKGKKTKQKIILLLMFLKMRYYIRKWLLTWAILIIETAIIPSFPPSCLCINSIGSLSSSMTTWWIVATCTTHSLIKKAYQNDFIERKWENMIYCVRVMLHTPEL